MTPVEIVGKIYAHYARGEIEAALAECDEDVRFVFTADPGYAHYSGAAIGKAEFRRRAQSLHDHFEYLSLTPVDFIAEGNRVAARTELHMRRRTTGREFLMKVANFWTLRNGKVVELVEYYDTALAAQVL